MGVRHDVRGSLAQVTTLETTFETTQVTRLGSRVSSCSQNRVGCSESKLASVGHWWLQGASGGHGARSWPALAAEWPAGAENGWHATCYRYFGTTLRSAGTGHHL